jgi:hypothetical protein
LPIQFGVLSIFEGYVSTLLWGISIATFSLLEAVLKVFLVPFVCLGLVPIQDKVNTAVITERKLSKVYILLQALIYFKLLYTYGIIYPLYLFV